MRLFPIGLLLLGATCAAQERTAATRTPSLGHRAWIGSPLGVAVDASGNLFFTSTNSVFELDRNGVVVRIAGTRSQGDSGDGGPAIEAQLHLNGASMGGSGGGVFPAALAIDKAGNLFVADIGNHRVRRISPDGIITAVAGDGTPGYSGDNGPAAGARLSYPSGLALDGRGSLFISDAGNQRVRRVSPDGVITTFAGDGTGAYFSTAVDGIPATEAQLAIPTAVAADALGNVFIVDSGANRIRKVSPAGIITTVAGTTNGSFNCYPSADGVAAVRAQICDPSGVAVDASGNVYFGDTVADFDGDFRQIVRKVSPDGILTTIAGVNCFDFCPIFGGDGGPATKTYLTGGLSLALDGRGGLLIADPLNFRIRRVSPDGIITAVVGVASEALAYKRGSPVEPAGGK